jgi:hypothetical protein
MSNRQPTEESFLNDVEKHEMKVLLDNGIYRHLRFKQPGSSNMWFDVVTWPGFLAYAGDMGAFVFARLEDMFEFFRTRPDDKDKLFINTGYWGEKLEAVDRYGRESGYLVFSPERLREHVEERIKGWVEDGDCPEVELREAIEEDIYRYLDDGEYEARRALGEFGCEINGHHYEFSDTWEWDCTEYTFRFVWCCYAVAYSIQQYDKFKDGAKDETCIACSL